MRFQLYDIPEKSSLQGRQNDQGLPGVGWGGMNRQRAEHF